MVNFLLFLFSVVFFCGPQDVFQSQLKTGKYSIEHKEAKNHVFQYNAETHLWTEFDENGKKVSCGIFKKHGPEYRFYPEFSLEQGLLKKTFEVKVIETAHGKYKIMGIISGKTTFEIV